MVQYHLDKNTLQLFVKRAPVIIIGIFYVVAFVGLLSPWLVMVNSGFSSGLIISIIILNLIGYYMLRIALWNTGGKEMIECNDRSVTYVADYGWFKDARKTFPFESISFEIVPYGYEDDKIGTLTIVMGEEKLSCVTKLPNAQLEEIVEKLNARYSTALNPS